MKTRTIGAGEAGRYGLKVGGKAAVIIQNRGGMGRGFLAEQVTVKSRSNIEAIREAAPKAGLDPEASVRSYLAQIGRKGGAAGTGPAKRRGDPEHYRQMAGRSRKPA